MKTSPKKKPVVIAIIIIVLLILAAATLLLGVFFGEGPFGKFKYPLEYTETISEEAQKAGLDPYLVAAVINTESGFDPDAVSPVGAIGLMQIMPETGEWIAGKLGYDDFSTDMLYDESTNIQFGCWYLSFLDERFSGDIPLITAAYNAGHNRVAEWLSDETISDGEALISIPFEETEQYVKKVTRAIEKYLEYYPQAF